MAEVVIGGVAYKIAPFTLAQLDAAADAIDAAQPLVIQLQSVIDAGQTPSMRLLADVAKTTLKVVHVGILPDQPDVKLEDLTAAIRLPEFPALAQALASILTEAGMQPGEPAAPPGAKPSRSRRRSS